MSVTQKLVTIADLETEFGMSRQTIRSRLANVEPVETVGQSRRFRLRDAARAILQVDRETLDASQEIARVNARRADQIELKNGALRRELVPTELVTSAVAHTAARVAAILDAVPGRLKRANPTLTQMDIARLKREIATARNAAAKIEIDWSSLDDG